MTERVAWSSEKTTARYVLDVQADDPSRPSAIYDTTAAPDGGGGRRSVCIFSWHTLMEEAEIMCAALNGS